MDTKKLRATLDIFKRITDKDTQELNLIYTKGANKMKHTKTPWETDETFIHPKGKKITIAEVYNRSNYMPANGYEIPNESEGKANAEFIVHAVNMHEKLVEALKEALEVINNDNLPDMKYFKSVLSQAERK